MRFSFEGTTLHVSDVERSLEFYRRVPEAVVRAHRPGSFALVEIGKARLGLLGVGASGQFHMEIYLRPGRRVRAGQGGRDRAGGSPQGLMGRQVVPSIWVVR